MGTASRILAKTANGAVSQLSSDQEGRLPKTSATGIVAQIAHSLWPAKPDQALSAKTGSSDRMCRYWLERKYRLSSDDLVCLIRTEEGFKILEALMADAKPIWWRDFKRSVKRADLRRQQMLLAKQIDENEQAELDV